MSSFLKLERKENNSSNAFQIRIFLFRSYSFGIESIITFIRFRTFENYTLFHTKMGEVYTRVGPKTVHFGAAHSHMTFIREYPPFPVLGGLPSPDQNFGSSVLLFHFRNILSGDGPRQIERCAPSLYFDWEANLVVLVSHWKRTLSARRLSFNSFVHVCWSLNGC